MAQVIQDIAVAEVLKSIEAKLPAAPSTDGSYVLICTVADGVATYSWESAN